MGQTRTCPKCGGAMLFHEEVHTELPEWNFGGANVSEYWYECEDCGYCISGEYNIDAWDDGY